MAEDLGRQVEILFRHLLALAQAPQQGHRQAEGNQHGQGVEAEGPLGLGFQLVGAVQQAVAEHLLETGQIVDVAGGQGEPLFGGVADAGLFLAGPHDHHQAADALGVDDMGGAVQGPVGGEYFRIGQLQEFVLPQLFHGLDAVEAGHAHRAEIPGGKHGGEQGPLLAGHFLGFQEKDEGHLLPVDPPHPAHAHGAQQVLEEGSNEGRVAIHYRLPGQPQTADAAAQAGKVVELFQGIGQIAGQGRMDPAGLAMHGVEAVDGAVGEVVLVLQGAAEALSVGGDEAAGEAPLLLQLVHQLADLDADFGPGVDLPGAVPVGLLFQQVEARQGGNGQGKGQ